MRRESTLERTAGLSKIVIYLAVNEMSHEQ